MTNAREMLFERIREQRLAQDKAFEHLQDAQRELDDIAAEGDKLRWVLDQVIVKGADPLVAMMQYQPSSPQPVSLARQGFGYVAPPGWLRRFWRWLW